MGKKLNRSALFDDIVDVMGFQPAGPKRPSSARVEAAKNADNIQFDDNEFRKKYLVRQMKRFVDSAYRRTNLDPDNSDHTVIMLMMMAFALFKPKGAGKPKKWRKKDNRRLIADVIAVQKAGPSRLSIAECCVRLVNENSAYREFGASTIRRAFYSAKKLEEA